MPRLSIIRTFHTMRPLICKSITIARTQDLSPSPSVLCLQPGRRLCCCTMLFLPKQSRFLDQATLPPVFSTNDSDYYTVTGPLQVYSNCHRHSQPALCATSTRDNDKGMFHWQSGSEWQTPHSSPSQSPVPAYPPGSRRSNKKFPPSIQA